MKQRAAGSERRHRSEKSILMILKGIRYLRRDKCRKQAGDNRYPHQ